MRVHRVLPVWAPMRAITIGRRVFAKRSVGSVTLAHEAVHVEQQRRDGWRFYLRYVFSPRWRVRYEAEAYAVNLRAGADAERLARLLAGPLYLWPCSAAAARRAVLDAASPRLTAPR